MSSDAEPLGPSVSHQLSPLADQTLSSRNSVGLINLVHNLHPEMGVKYGQVPRGPGERAAVGILKVMGVLKDKEEDGF